MLLTITEYKDALLFEDAFRTLKNLKPVLDEEGEYIFSTGRSAVVFKMQDSETGKYKALKCFTSLSPEQQEHINEVAAYLEQIISPYLIPYEFIEEELWVATSFDETKYYPVLLMDWVEGVTMGSYIQKLVDDYDTSGLLKLALAFDRMAIWLLGEDFAHGDLKHDNILILENGMPVMVDYDGCFVPEMAGKKALELGTPGFQHPKRDENFFCKEIDEVSILVITTSLHALSEKPLIWDKYHNGENMLFTLEDLKGPEKSEVFTTIRSFKSAEAINRLNILGYGLKNSLKITWIIQILKIDSNDEFKKINFATPKIISSEFKYDAAYSFSAGLARVKLEKKWILINRSGEIGFDFDFQDTPAPFSEGLAAVKMNGWGFINKSGEIVINCKYNDYPRHFSEGLAGVKLNGKWRFIDSKGRLRIECEMYSNVYSFSEGYAHVRFKNQEGFIDKEGSLKKESIYDGVTSFSEGLAMVQKNENIGFIDKNGNKIIALLYKNGKSFKEGLASVELNRKWGFIDKSGNVVIDFLYENTNSFSEGLAPVKLNGTWGYINKIGEKITEFKYTDSGNFSEGLALVKLNEMWGFIDKNEKIIVDFKYENAHPFSEGFAAVKLKEKWGYIDNNGNLKF